jgi:hypothetical protein
MKWNDRFASHSRKIMKIPTDFLKFAQWLWKAIEILKKNAKFLLVLAFFGNLLREYKIFAFAKLNKNNITGATCHQIVTVRVKAVLTLAVPVMPSWCWKSPSVFLAYTNTIGLSRTNQSIKLYKKITRSNRSINHRSLSSTSLHRGTANASDRLLNQTNNYKKEAKCLQHLLWTPISEFSEMKTKFSQKKNNPQPHHEKKCEKIAMQ